jgi:ethanolamine ammonia-lyase small subunit
MANAVDCLEAIQEGLKAKGISVGKVPFVRYCRVGAGDAIGDITGCEVVCMLVGERPGLVTDKSMSCYITYKPHTGVSESSRTVVSNIHSQGTPAVEAGAHVANLIGKILEKKVSGVGLHLEG